MAAPRLARRAFGDPAGRRKELVEGPPRSFNAVRPGAAGVHIGDSG
jgi:hypothetical protein